MTGGRARKLMGQKAEWELCRIVNERYPDVAFAWHIGGNAPGWDVILFRLDSSTDGLLPTIPGEVKSFVCTEKIYGEHTIKQYKTYMGLFEKYGIMTIYYLKKKAGRAFTEEERLNRWRAIPVTEVTHEHSPKGAEYIIYNWDRGIPIKKFLDMLYGGKKPTKADRRKWEWLK